MAVLPGWMLGKFFKAGLQTNLGPSPSNAAQVTSFNPVFDAKLEWVNVEGECHFVNVALERESHLGRTWGAVRTSLRFVGGDLYDLELVVVAFVIPTHQHANNARKAKRVNPVVKVDFGLNRHHAPVTAGSSF